MTLSNNRFDLLDHILPIWSLQYKLHMVQHVGISW
jgi:hypothetical protein